MDPGSGAPNVSMLTIALPMPLFNMIKMSQTVLTYLQQFYSSINIFVHVIFINILVQLLWYSYIKLEVVRMVSMKTCRKSYMFRFTLANHLQYLAINHGKKTYQTFSYS